MIASGILARPFRAGLLCNATTAIGDFSSSVFHLRIDDLLIIVKRRAKVA